MVGVFRKQRGLLPFFPPSFSNYYSLSWTWIVTKTGSYRWDKYL